MNAWIISAIITLIIVILVWYIYDSTWFKNQKIYIVTELVINQDKIEIHLNQKAGLFLIGREMSLNWYSYSLQPNSEDPCCSNSKCGPTTMEILKQTNIKITGIDPFTFTKSIFYMDNPIKEVYNLRNQTFKVSYTLTGGILSQKVKSCDPTKDPDCDPET